ncbi:uncharacterized protein LOC141901287 [Tubulanus polymorphus]|uniref:uncharacterized protein LOC141901287 n=1 Tax=Tubulanus polymorphus TaxID=672921 RepID=UPI003DA50842
MNGSNGTSVPPSNGHSGAFGDILMVFVGYIAPVCYIQGIVGNTGSLYIFIRSRKLRHKDVLDYLLPLCVADLILLVFGAMVTWLHLDMPNAIGGADNIRTNILSTPASCKILSYLGWVGGFSASWIIALFTLERVVSVSISHTIMWLTRRKRLIAIALVALLGILILIPVLVTYDIDDDGYFIECVYTYKESQGTISFLGPFLLFFVIYLLPVFFVCIGNGIITWALMAKRKRDDPTDPVDLERQDREMKVIKQLLVISMLYLVCVIPAAALDLIMFQFDMQKSDPDNDLLHAYDFVNRLIYMNNSFNYVAYILTLDWFRREVKSICCPTRVNVDYNEMTEEAFAIVRGQNYGGAYSRM